MKGRRYENDNPDNQSAVLDAGVHHISNRSWYSGDTSMSKEIQCRWAQSLGELEDTHQNVWGTTDYTDRRKPCVFFGLYDLRDYYALWRHRGKAWVFWAGSDILNLKNKFLFNDGKLKKLSKSLPFFHRLIINIVRRHENWCENTIECQALRKLDIKAKIGYSYLGQIPKITYKWNIKPKVFVSCGRNRQKEYGFEIVEQIAPFLPDFTFYLYGDDWTTDAPNIISRGRVSKETFNRETAKMMIGLRLNKFDGFSEIMAKAVLRGQYCISRIPYPHIPCYRNVGDLIEKLRYIQAWGKNPYQFRDFYIEKKNKFPWVCSRPQDKTEDIGRHGV